MNKLNRNQSNTLKSILALVCLLKVALTQKDILNESNASIFVIDGNLHVDSNKDVLMSDVFWGKACRATIADRLNYEPILWLQYSGSGDRAYAFGFDMNTSQTIGSFFIYTGDRFRDSAYFNNVVIDGTVRVGDSTDYEDNPICTTVYD